MEGLGEEQHRTDVVESAPAVVSLSVPEDDTTKNEQPATMSLVQSLLQEPSDEVEDKKKKKKKKGKAGRQKEIVKTDFIQS